MTSRVAWLVEEEFEDPSRIVVATFTTRAAQEMKQRLESPELLGKVKSDQLMMGTFHNICGTLLRQYGGLIHVNSNFTVADADVRYVCQTDVVWPKNARSQMLEHPLI